MPVAQLSAVVGELCTTPVKNNVELYVKGLSGRFESKQVFLDTENHGMRTGTEYKREPCLLTWRDEVLEIM